MVNEKNICYVCHQVSCLCFAKVCMGMLHYLECLDLSQDEVMEGFMHPSTVVLSDHLVQLTHCYLFLPES